MTRVLVERTGAIGRLTLARPEKRNALDRATADELFAGIELFTADESVRVLVVGALGQDFCAGADIEALERLLEASPPAHRDDAAALGRVFLALRATPKATVAVVRGKALAGGAGLATACDIVLASEDATFGYPEVRVGFVPAMVMTMLRRCVGEKEALDLVLTGRRVTAADAHRMGLVSRVLPGDGFEDEVNSVVDALAAIPAEAVAHTKQLFMALDDATFSRGIEAGIEANVAARATAAFRDGVRAFLERRGERG